MSFIYFFHLFTLVSSPGNNFKKLVRISKTCRKGGRQEGREWTINWEKIKIAGQHGQHNQNNKNKKLNLNVN
jgi:hypothetical protein